MKLFLHISLMLIVLALFCSVVFADIPAAAIRTQDKADICTTKTSGIRHIEIKQKYAAMKALGMKLSDSGKVEWDHIISLTDGGSNDIVNMQIQSYFGKCNAHDKDRLEVKLHSLICHDKVDVNDAQELLYNHWQEGYKQYINARGC